MALANVSINKVAGSIASALQNNDGISGMVFYDTTLTPGEYTIYELKDLEDEGFEEGVADVTNVVHYHVSEYFKFTTAKLYVKILAAFDDFACLDSESQRANGEIKLWGIYDNINDIDSTNITLLQTEIDKLADDRKVASCVPAYSADVPTNVEALTDMTTINADSVAVCISQDLTGDSQGYLLFDALTDTLVGTMGTLLGKTSDTGVSDSVAATKTGNIAVGAFDILGFIDGSSYISKSKTFLDQLDTYQYTFLRKVVGLAGSYFNFDYTISSNADFSQVTLNRVYNKGFDACYRALVTELNSKLYTKNDGSGMINVMTEQVFIDKISTALNQMVGNGEMNDYTVIIPEQDVVTSKTIKITLEVQIFAYSKFISVDFKYKL